MSSLVSFMKKEWMEQIRSGRLMILCILFVIFGIMNPAIAKLTPWLLETMADSLAQSGMTVTAVTVTAMDSWVQFFKNFPMGLIAFILLESSIFTKEYQSGTLVLALTKGLKRSNVVISKAAVLAIIWTLGYWMYFGITYAYTAYYWDNSVAQNLMFSIFCCWLLGLWVVILAVFFSTTAKSNTAVLAGTGLVYFAMYLVSLFPKWKKYSPALLMDGNSLIYGMEDIEAYTAAIIVTAVMCVVLFVASIPILDRKQI